MAIFNPAFENAVLARRREAERAAAKAPRDVVKPPPLAPARPGNGDAGPVTVAYCGGTADALRRVARARGETPQVLAAALVAEALRNGAAEEMLADRRADEIADGQGRRPVAGHVLTLRQRAVLYLIGRKGGVAGWCGWSPAALARLMPSRITADNVGDAVAVLVARRLAERGRATGATVPRPVRLTADGAVVYAELAGDFGDDQG